MKKIITILLVCFALVSNAQEDLDDFKSFKTDKSSEYDATKAVFKLSFLFPSVGAEVRLAEKFSLDLGVRLGINAGVAQNSTGSFNFYFFPQPSFLVEPKWNYNIRKRDKRGKKTMKFSSNFLSLHTSFNAKVSSPTFNYLTVGPTWGIQRNLGKYGYFKFKTGLGYMHIFEAVPGSYLPLTPIINLHLGVMF